MAWWFFSHGESNGLNLGRFRFVRDRKFTWVGWCLKARGAGFLDRLVKIRQHFGVRRKGQLRLVRPQDERDQSETEEKVGSCNCPHTHTANSHRPRHDFCRSQKNKIILSSQKYLNPWGKQLGSKQNATSQGISRPRIQIPSSPTTPTIINPLGDSSDKLRSKSHFTTQKPGKIEPNAPKRNLMNPTLQILSRRNPTVEFR